LLQILVHIGHQSQGQGREAETITSPKPPSQRTQENTGVFQNEHAIFHKITLCKHFLKRGAENETANVFQHCLPH
jgi:hypothetical protein